MTVLVVVGFLYMSIVIFVSFLCRVRSKNTIFPFFSSSCLKVRLGCMLLSFYSFVSTKNVC
jgi:hypothetical protein